MANKKSVKYDPSLRKVVETAKKQVSEETPLQIPKHIHIYDEKTLNEALARADTYEKRFWKSPNTPLRRDAIDELDNAYEFVYGIKEKGKREKYLGAINRRVNRLAKGISRGLSGFEKKTTPPKTMLRYTKARERIQELQEGIERAEKRRGLTGKIAGILGLAGLIIGLFFLSSNLTGFVVSNLTQNSSNIIGIILFILGLVGAFIYFRK